MRRLLVLGGGTAGTMVVNKLRRRLDRDRWQITVVDQDDVHQYQPRFLLPPFGRYRTDQLVKPRQRLLATGVEFVVGEIDRVVPAENAVLLAGGRRLPYDYLVIATGTSPRPDQTPGMLGRFWRRPIFDFFTLDGARALGDALPDVAGGRLVVHTVDTRIKRSVAPLEFTTVLECVAAGTPHAIAGALVHGRQAPFA